MIHQSQSSDKSSGLSPQTLSVHALEGAANAIFITDDRASIVWANEAFCRLCGYDLHELLGKSPAILSSGMQSKSYYARLWQTILTGNGLARDNHRSQERRLAVHG